MEILCKPMAGRKAFFLPGCRPVERRLFVSVNPSHAMHVREPGKILACSVSKRHVSRRVGPVSGWFSLNQVITALLFTHETALAAAMELRQPQAPRPNCTCGNATDASGGARDATPKLSARSPRRRPWPRREKPSAPLRERKAK